MIKMTDYHTAYAVGKSLSISHKHAREILATIKGMKIDNAISKLQRVIEKKEAIPFKRFNRKVAHKPGMGPGRYPEKACREIIKILKEAKNNAINKGLQEDKLIIKEGITMMDISKRRRIRSRKGRYTGSMKLTSVKITVEEKEND